MPLVMVKFCPGFPGPAEVEPNDTPAEANGPLCSGMDYSGTHDDADDYFKFALGTGGPITVRLDASAPDAQLLLYYRSSTGYVQVGHVGGGARPFVINYTGVAGEYYVRVVTGGCPPCPNGPYTLRVTYP